MSLANCSSISGKGDYTIVSDLPLQGANRLQTTQMVNAIKYALKQHNYKAGKYTVQYQSCDDATAQAGKWDSATCSANARAYAQADDIVGVIGTFNPAARRSRSRSSTRSRWAWSRPPTPTWA